MHSGPRVAALRIAALAGLGVSAAMQADAVQPGRKFCPFESACEKAHSSLLGSFFGVSTALFGMAAFALFFVVTLLPVEVSRRLARLLGAGAFAFAVTFLGYQALVLGSFCPLCLGADGAALIVGLLALTWPPLPRRPSGLGLPPESGGSRLWWGTFAAIALALPFGWPREQAPAWVEVTPVDLEGDTMALVLPEAEDVPQDVSSEGRAPEGPSPSESLAWEIPSGHVTPPPALAAGETPPPAGPPRGGAAFTVSAPDRAEPTEPPLASAPQTSPAPRPPASPRAVADPRDLRAPEIRGGPQPVATRPPAESSPPPASSAPAPAAAPAPTPRATAPVVIVEYLNAFCPHCRAMHERLKRVVATSDVPVRRHRIYAWATDDYPAWARACAFAQTVGREETLFSELLKARDQSAAEIHAAGRRAGLDSTALAQALRDPMPPERLLHDRRIARQARLQGLPTLDIGRRRLMGEATEAELRDAIRAAKPASSL